MFATVLCSLVAVSQAGDGPTPAQMADAVRRILPYFEVSNRQRILQQLESPEPLAILEGGKKRLRLGIAGASFDLRTGELLSFWCSLAPAEPRQATDAEVEARARQLLDALPPIQCQRFEVDIYRKGSFQDSVMFQHFYGTKRCSNWAHVMIEAKTGRVEGSCSSLG